MGICVSCGLLRGCLSDKVIIPDTDSRKVKGHTRQICKGQEAVSAKDPSYELASCI